MTWTLPRAFLVKQGTEDTTATYTIPTAALMTLLL